MMKWFTKVRNWWYEQNDVALLVQRYTDKQVITDEEMERQDDLVCPSDTPSSVAVENGKTLWDIWRPHMEVYWPWKGDHDNVQMHLRFCEAHPRPLNSPQTARIEHHAQSDEYGMAEALRRFDSEMGIVRNKNGEPMPAMTAVVQTNRGYGELPVLPEHMRAENLPQPKSLNMKWPDPPFLLYVAEADYENVVAHVYRTRIKFTPLGNKFSMSEKVDVIDGTTEAMPHQRLTERPYDGPGLINYWQNRGFPRPQAHINLPTQVPFPAPIGCEWVTGGFYAVNDDPDGYLIQYGDWEAHEAAVARAIAASKRPSRGTEEVPVRQVLREVQNASVPHNREPKHRRGQELLPGQIGVEVDINGQGWLSEMHPGVHARTNTE